MALAAACSGSTAGPGKTHGQDGGTQDAATDNGDSGGVIKVPGDIIVIGDSVDLDGDGKSDGDAVDTDGDGIPDGVDTDGDGDVDLPLPGADGGTPIPSDAGIPFPVDDAGQVLCDGVPCACSDGLDNDNDGVKDLADPECVSTWDNDEGSLATGISGDNRDDACQDCFFDGNSGSGNDGCRLPSSCLTEGNASSGQGSCNKCEQSDQCKNFCRAYTPNGCDCFGCCDVLVGGSVKHVALTPTCNIDGDTLENCTECVPSTTCVNTCGKCELCPGKTLSDLPSDCFPVPGSDAGTGGGGDGGTSEPPGYTCDNGEQLCGAGRPACPADSLCQFGCCVLSPIVVL
jgi:hypothetical protein